MQVLRACNKKLLIGDKTLVMGILNVTPDSFSDGGKYYDTEKAVKHGIEMVEGGADIIDVGGESTRPGAVPVPAEEEQKRVLPVIEALHEQVDAVISVDTYKPDTAEKALKMGASIVNDVYALRKPGMVEVVSEYDAGVVLMHMKGTPATMQQNPSYKDLVGEIRSFLEDRVRFATEHGVDEKNIVVDPGIGFGKTLEHNFEIIAKLSEIKIPGYPLLVGPSRKSFIAKTLGLPHYQLLEGTISAVVAAILNGADIIRVHDVEQVVKAVKIVDKIKFFGVDKSGFHPDRG